MVAALILEAGFAPRVTGLCQTCATAIGLTGAPIVIDWPTVPFVILLLTPFAMIASVFVTVVPTLIAIILLDSYAPASRVTWIAAGSLLGLLLSPGLIGFMQSPGAAPWDDGSVFALRVAGVLAGGASASIARRSLIRARRGVTDR